MICNICRENRVPDYTDGPHICTACFLNRRDE